MAKDLRQTYIAILELDVSVSGGTKQPSALPPFMCHPICAIFSVTDALIFGRAPVQAHGCGSLSSPGQTKLALDYVSVGVMWRAGLRPLRVPGTSWPAAIDPLGSVLLSLQMAPLGERSQFRDRLRKRGRLASRLRISVKVSDTKPNCSLCL
jgi:hypothetical protein